MPPAQGRAAGMQSESGGAAQRQHTEPSREQHKNTHKITARARTVGFAAANEVRHSGRAAQEVLRENDARHSVGSGDANDGLRRLLVVKAAIPGQHERAAFHFVSGQRVEQRLREVLQVVRLLELGDLLAQACMAKSNARNAWRRGQKSQVKSIQCDPTASQRGQLDPTRGPAGLASKWDGVNDLHVHYLRLRHFRLESNAFPTRHPPVTSQEQRTCTRLVPLTGVIKRAVIRSAFAIVRFLHRITLHCFCLLTIRSANKPLREWCATGSMTGENRVKNSLFHAPTFDVSLGPLAALGRSLSSPCCSV
jgi:hypothetical protein